MDNDTLTYSVKASNYFWLPVNMPIAGRCFVAFESYDDRSDLTVAATDAAGAYVGVTPKIKGDIELFFVDPDGLELFKAGRSFVKLWSSGRAYSGKTVVSLPAGGWYLVINNGYSTFASKAVKVTIGGPGRRP